MASKSIGTLTLDIVAKTGSFIGPMDKANRKVKETKTTIGGLKKTAIGLTAAMAATAAGVSVFVKSSINAAANARKTAQAVGVTTESLTALQWAANQGTIGGTQVLEKGLVRLNASLGDAARGTKLQQETFENLGVSIRDANGELKSADDVLLELADRFSESADGAGKTDAAVKLLGRSGADLIPLLNSGSKGIKELTDQAKALGLVISDEQAQQSEKFNDSLATLGAIGKGVANQIARELLPSLNEMTGLLIDLATDSETANVAAEVLSGTMKALGTGAVLVIDSLTKLVALLDAIKSSGLSDMGDVEFDELIGEFTISQKKQDESKSAWTTFLSDIETSNKKTLERINKIWDGGYSGQDKSLVKSATSSGSSVIDVGGGETDSGKLEKYIESLKKQVEMLDETGAKLELYKQGIGDVSEAQLDTVDGLLAAIDAHEKHNEMLEEGKALTESLRTPAEQFGDAIERLTELQKEGAITAETYSRALKQQASEGFSDAPGFQGTGGAAGESGMIASQNEELEKWYTEQMELLQQYREERSDLNELWDQREEEINKQHQARMTEIEGARYQLIMTSAESYFDSMAAMAKEWAGEESETYKTLFAISKAFAIAQSTINMYKAISDVGNTEQGWTSKLAAMASMAAEMGAIVAAVSAVGMADDGIMSVPKSGTWLLEKGERVTTAETSAKLDLVLSDIQNKQGGASPMNVNVYEAPGTTATVRQSSDGQSMDVIVEQVENQLASRMSRGTGLDSFMRTRYGGRRR